MQRLRVNADKRADVWMCQPAKDSYLPAINLRIYGVSNDSDQRHLCGNTDLNFFWVELPVERFQRHSIFTVSPLINRAIRPRLYRLAICQVYA